jgi:hypothetical protein
MTTGKTGARCPRLPNRDTAALASMEEVKLVQFRHWRATAQSIRDGFYGSRKLHIVAHNFI